MGYVNRSQDVILEKFWKMSPEQSGIIYPSIPSPDIVYHYTSRETGISILDNLIKGQSDGTKGDKCGFAFTDYRFLNDDKEITIGLKLVKRWLKKTPGDLEKLVNRILHALSYNAKSNFVPHILSFSLSCDCAVNWMTYTSRENGGYAIGLRHAHIEKEVNEFNLRKEVKSEMLDMSMEYFPPLIFYPCIYCPQSVVDGKLRGERFDRFNRDFIGLLDNVFAGVGTYLYDKKHNEDGYRSCVNWCVERLLQLVCLVKSDEFRFENEWRLVIRPELLKIGVDNKIIGGKPRAIPKQLNLCRCIKSLIASPHGDSRRLRLLGDFQLQRLGRKFRTKPSKSYYNGK